MDSKLHLQAKEIANRISKDLIEVSTDLHNLKQAFQNFKQQHPDTKLHWTGFCKQYFQSEEWVQKRLEVFHVCEIWKKENFGLELPTKLKDFRLLHTLRERPQFMQLCWKEFLDNGQGTCDKFKQIVKGKLIFCVYFSSVYSSFFFFSFGLFFFFGNFFGCFFFSG
jgi:hypothetical protein